MEPVGEERRSTGEERVRINERQLPLLAERLEKLVVLCELGIAIERSRVSRYRHSQALIDSERTDEYKRSTFREKAPESSNVPLKDRKRTFVPPHVGAIRRIVRPNRDEHDGPTLIGTGFELLAHPLEQIFARLAWNAQVVTENLIGTTVKGVLESRDPPAESPTPYAMLSPNTKTSI